MFRLSCYPVGDSYLLVAVAALVLVGLLALGPARNKTTRGRRAVLAGIRLGVILLAVLAMLRPTLVYTETKKQPATLVILADRSRSMSVPDAIGGKTRWEILRRALDEAAPDLNRLGKDFEIKAYTFDAEPHAATVSGGKIELPDTPDGQETALGATIEEVLRTEASQRLLGVILLSDGAQRAYAPRDTPPQTAASRMKHLGCPLFTFPIGQARHGKDIAVKELLANQQVFVKNRMAITGQIRIDGYTNQKIPVRLIVEPTPGQPQMVDQIEVTATGDDQLVPFQFSYVPLVPGEYKLTADVVKQPGERVISNNQMSTFVNVLKGGLSVLYIEGELRWEQKYLRRALGASEDIKVDYLRIDPRNLQATKPADLAGRFKPGKYDVYILGDLDSTAFTADEMTALARAVSQGAGLIMLGGLHTFGPGGYAETPLAVVLPVKMKRLERQNLQSEVSSDLHLPGPLQMRPTVLGARHFSLLLAPTPQESAALWEKLWPLDGANKFGDLAPGATVLAAAGNAPLLVGQSFGNGRVMVFAADSTWRWWTHGFAPAHKRFWRQIVLWLARKDLATEGNVWVKFHERRLAPNERAEFVVGGQSASGEPVTELSGEAEVQFPDGTRRRVELIRQDNLLSGTIRETRAPGDYTVTVTARHKDELLGTARGRFLVYQQDLELDNAAADAPLLESLAAMTGGQRLAPEQLPDLVRRLAQGTDSLLVRQETKRTFWDTWPFFLVFVALLGVEWYLRKRWGLV